MDAEAQTLTSSDEIALLGKPKLGELYKCTVRIKESKEFKVCGDELLMHNLTNSLAFISRTWWIN